MITKQKIYSFFGGLVAGAVAATMYAPQSGAATRRRLLQGMEEAGNSLSEAGEYLQGQANHLNAEAQATIAHTQSQIQQVIDQASSALTSTLKQASDAFAASAGDALTAIKDTTINR